MRGTARTTPGMVASRPEGTVNVAREHWFPRIETPRRRVKGGISTVIALLLVASLAHVPVASATHDSVVWAWGSNGSGQLGDGTTNDRSTPVKVSGLTGVTAVAAGQEHSLGLVEDGTVRAWGSNMAVQLGDNSTAGTNQTTPVQVVGPTGELHEVTQLATGAFHSMAVDSSQLLWAWGSDQNGQLGLNDTGGFLWPSAQQVIEQVNSVADGLGNHSLAVLGEGLLLAWGFNSNGQIGDGTMTHRLGPVPVAGELTPSAVAAGAWHSLAVVDGTVWSWGRNQFGQLGDGTTTDQLTPVLVGSGVGVTLTGVAEVAGGGAHSLALLENGTVWSWGQNQFGQLGDGTTTDQLVAVQVVGLSGVVDIAAGLGHSLALLDDGTVWAWGENTAGQLGDGTATNQPIPVQVDGLTGVTAIAAGSNHSLAVGQDVGTSDGTLTAAVVVAAPTEACVLLTVSALDFGTLDFGASATSSAYELSSCSSGPQDVFAQASDAVSSSAAAISWALTAPPRAEDQFSVDAATLDGARVWLTSEATPMGTLEAASTAPGRDHVLEMPPVGSTGAGESMTFDILWTAVLSSP